MHDAARPPVATCVVGAGPAGLLFCLSAGIRREALGLTASWPIVLVDKRTTYERTHRLRIDPAPYLSAQRELDHPLFDELIDFLESQRFKPAANALETVLLELVGRLGITKLRATIGPGRKELDLRRLRRALEQRQVVGSESWLSVIGADSVNSAVRNLVADDTGSVERVHQTVVRLRLDGDDLPDRLDRVQQFKLAKLLGSALDYRSNPNGFAEVDLFLSPDEHEVVVDLGARPGEPVVVTAARLDHLDAPLFAQIARYLMANLGSGGCDVAISSTFRLEHRYSEHVAFVDGEAAISVCLVGDAAVSLPFFRGMACLMKSVHSLAMTQADLAVGAVDHQTATSTCDRYDAVVAEIRSAEVRTVERRAGAVRLARELVRVSSLSPFPIQTWLLSVRSSAKTTDGFSPRLLLTMLVSSLAAYLAIASPQIGLFGLLSLPLQACAGFLYRSGLDAPEGPNLWVSTVCRLQMLALMIAGVAIAVGNPYDSGPWIRLGAAVGWFVLGLVFIAGMYAAEHRSSRSR